VHLDASLSKEWTSPHIPELVCIQVAVSFLSHEVSLLNSIRLRNWSRNLSRCFVCLRIFPFRLLHVKGCEPLHFLYFNRLISGSDSSMCHKVFESLSIYFLIYSLYYRTLCMQCFCNSWCVRNLLVIVLRLNKSLKLAESIVSLYTHQIAQAKHQLWFLSTVNSPLLVCHRHCQRRPLSIALKFDAERCLPHTAGDLNISNYTILNTFKLQAKRIWLYTAHPDALNPLSIVL